ncbi:hypothetical protein [Actinoallomurus rhizosphaericola]|uniref:hypothetical protein n=2 Tax=Actinoallomurus TaxID=667113 RepID=UPI0020924631|nr:hypothetical protein [Actinoallomurus rhizosphaericola]MCO5999587.1 hypothetical protein [Actinoallomurus rhizosphaericola]
MPVSKPMTELHLRVVGQTTDWKLLLHDEPPTEDQLVGWMQDGAVARLLVAEQGSNQPHVLLVNFSLVVSARVVATVRGRGVTF